MPQKLANLQRRQKNLLTSIKLPLPRNVFVEYSNYVPQHEYNSARNSIEIEDIGRNGSKSGKNSQSIVYCTIKSIQKHHRRQQYDHYNNKEQQNPSQPHDNSTPHHLPKIPSQLKNHMMTRYFNRFDIVKDRAQTKSMNGGWNNNKLMKLKTQQHDDDDDDGNISKSVKWSRYQQQMKHPGGNSNNYNNNSDNKQSIKLWRNNSTISLINHHNNSNPNPNLSDEMRQLQLIKKKNEYQMYKMKRKNDYERMRSNFIIAEALNELIGKRQKVLLDDKYEELGSGNSQQQQMENSIT